MDVVKEKASNKILPYIKAIEKNKLNAPLSLHILLNDHCVNKCNMCEHWKTKDKKYLSLDAIEEIWSRMNENDGKSICLTGGDPILHPDFDEILQLNRSFALGIICTGNFKNNFDYSLLKDVEWLRFSVDSLDKNIYNYIRGLDNLDSILSNIKKSQNFVKKVGINFTIQKINCDELENIAKYCAENNIYRLMLYPAHGNKKLCINRDDTIRILLQLTAIFGKDYHHIIPENNFEFLYESLKESIIKSIDVKDVYRKELPCMINKIHLAIAANGEVYPCEVAIDDTDKQEVRNIWVEYNDNKLVEKKIINSLGNVNEVDIVDIWNRNYYKNYRCDKCDRCFSRYQPIIESYWKFVNNKENIFI